MLRDYIETLTPTDTVVLAWAAVLGTLLLALTSNRSSLPLVNDRKPFEIRYTHARRRFVSDAKGLMEVGFAKSKSVFRLVTDNDVMHILSPKLANEIRSHPALNFSKAIAKEFHTHLPGFEPFRTGTETEDIIQDAVRMKLTQALGRITQPLSDEAALTLDKNWGNDPEWREITLKSTVLQIVAQLSSRVFLGDKLCRNPDWIRITIDYTVDSFQAASTLKMWPMPLRRVVSWFAPYCRNLRAQVKEAREIISPVLAERRAEKEACRKAGKTPERYNDAMEWLDETSKGRPYDATIAQLGISLAAIHTTSDLLTQVIYDIAGNEDLLRDLREEISTVLQAEGWKKTSLYKLKLVDSVVKETQRVKPVAITSMRRLAEENIKLSDGTLIPKGSVISVSSDTMWDPSIYPNPEVYDPYRFLKLRETPGNENTAQLVSVTPEHMAFGYGKHACPGRFFASNEVKVALCHILMKYDLKLATETKPAVLRNGFALATNPFGKILIRRRQEEFAL